MHESNVTFLGYMPSPLLVYILRLYIHMILCCRFESFATIWATVCSSWVRINCFTSQRSILLPEEDTSKAYIREANCMMSRILVSNLIRVFGCIHVKWWPKGICLYHSGPHHESTRQWLRCVLLLALVVACGGSWLLEQPQSSCMFHYFRMEWFLTMTKVPWLYSWMFYI